jgi:hypothetical protein
MGEWSVDEELKDMADTILVIDAKGNVGSEVVGQLASVAPNVNNKAAGHSLQRLDKGFEI